MKKLWLALALMLVSATALAQSNVRPIYADPSIPNNSVPVDTTHGLPVQNVGSGSPAAPTSIYAKNFGTTTWTKTAFALNGSSQTLLASSNTRVGFIVYNASANANVFLDVAGGTVASETGILVPPGGRFSVIGSPTPKTAITVIGTNAQTLQLWEGN